MPRQSIAALGLLALALAVGAAARPAAAEDHAATPKAVAEHAIEEGGHAAPGHAGSAEPDILEPQPALALWTVVVFLGLLFVLGKFAWKPLLNALHQREEHLEHVLSETERARNESEQLLAEHRRRMAEAEDRARALIEEARTRAAATAEEVLQKARAEAEAERQRALRDIENARDNALGEIWSRTADLAVSVAGKVLSRSLDDNEHRRLVDSAIHELPTSPNGHGGHTA